MEASILDAKRWSKGESIVGQKYGCCWSPLFKERIRKGYVGH